MRIADPAPSVCSVCLQPASVREPRPRYVDFEVAYDGPVLTRHGEEISSELVTPVRIDDLIVCEDCLRRAAELIGMEEGEEARARITELEEIVAARDEEIAAKDKAISNHDYTVGYLIDAQKAAKRPHGKPRIEGPETHAKEITELRKDRVAREKRAKKVKARA